METKIYVKVIIKSEADLPQEDGWYAVHSKGTNNDDYHSSCSMGNLYKEAWLRIYDWYLLPVDLQTDEELNEYAFKLVPTCILKGHESVGDVNEDCRKSIIEALKWLRDKLLNNPLK